MGLTTFGEIAKQLIAGGRDPETPAAAIRWGTRPDQQTLIGTVANLAERIAEAKLRPPALIIVGEVVALREDLNWFEKLPLFGQRIVLTRAEEQAGESAEQLRRLGADVVAAPTIEFREPSSWAPIDAAIAKLETYDWLIFTSRNGVERFLARLDASERDLRAVKGRIAAIGPATAEALAAARLKVDCLPKEFVAESLLEALDSDLTGKKILIPRAEVAREVLPEGLRGRGARLTSHRSIARSFLIRRRCETRSRLSVLIGSRLRVRRRCGSLSRWRGRKRCGESASLRLGRSHRRRFASMALNRLLRLSRTRWMG